jgi:hypothetical protein
MPYITKDEVAKIRKEVRTEFPEYKLSVRTENYSTVAVTVMAGPIDMGKYTKGFQVNHYAIDGHFSEEPEIRDFLNKLAPILTRNTKEDFVDSDYGSVPNFYVRITIGDWNKHYEKTK